MKAVACAVGLQALEGHSNCLTFLLVPAQVCLKDNFWNTLNIVRLPLSYLPIKYVCQHIFFILVLVEYIHVHTYVLYLHILGHRMSSSISLCLPLLRLSLPDPTTPRFVARTATSKHWLSLVPTPSVLEHTGHAACYMMLSSQLQASLNLA